MIPCPNCGHASEHTIDGGCHHEDSDGSLCPCSFMHWHRDLYADEPLPTRTEAYMSSFLTIHPYKKDGVWMFDDPAVGLVEEPFVQGTDAILDVITKKLPDAEDGFTAHFSAEPFDGHEFEFTWVAEENGGNWYRNVRLGMDGWLCPALFKYFAAAPAKLYLRIEPNENVDG